VETQLWKNLDTWHKKWPQNSDSITFDKQSYQDSLVEALLWYSDGGSWFKPPAPTAIGLTTIFFLPIFAALLAIRYRKRAVYLFGALVNYS
jgi:hypothetical protein